MNELEKLNKEIKETGFLIFTTHKNSNFFDVLTVIEEREKAIKVEHEHLQKPVWIPKKGFNQVGNAWTLAQWFRKSLQKERNDYPFYALGIIG